MSVRKDQPRLIILSAPSGAGKTTLCERLIKEDDTVRLSISTTTRPIRPYEKEGVHYHFVSKEAFEKKVQHGDFAEWAWVHGNRYGTSKSTIENFLAKGKHVVFDIDVQGALNLKKLYPTRALLLFIEPPSFESLEKRLRGRDSESPEAIALRLENARKEMGYADQFHYRIVNDELEHAYAQLRKILGAECR